MDNNTIFKKGNIVKIVRLDSRWNTPRFSFYLHRKGIIRNIYSDVLHIEFEPPHFNGDFLISFLTSEVELLNAKQPEDWL